MMSIWSRSGHWDMKKEHAPVAQNKFGRQNVKNTTGSEYFWKLRQTNRQTDKQASKQTNEQTDRQTNRHQWVCSPIDRSQQPKLVSDLWNFRHRLVRYYWHVFRIVYRTVRIPNLWRRFFCSWTNGRCVFGASPAARLKFLRPRLRGSATLHTIRPQIDPSLVNFSGWSSQLRTPPSRQERTCQSFHQYTQYASASSAWSLFGSDLGTRGWRDFKDPKAVCTPTLQNPWSWINTAAYRKGHGNKEEHGKHIFHTHTHTTINTVVVQIH